ncbi:MAG: protein translocase subunit SecF [Candidatus Aenigmarchaeota archaeon]|nr:protein translocase subunit SecF [Candidatus Aenigmarchaeota archaeon]
MKMITDYKKLLLISLILAVFSVGVLGYNYSTTGDILDKSIDFKGGTVASVAISDTDLDLAFVEGIAKDKLGKVVVRTTSGNIGTSIVFESENVITQESISDILDSAAILHDKDDINIQSVGAALGEEFMRQAITAIIFAFVLMGLIIFLTFRTIVPSVAIISAAILDILFAMALMVIFNISLSLGTLAALLLLIGYSVDTDILLTTRLIKRKSEGTLDERVSSSMKTGITMTTSAIAAFSVLYLVSTSVVLDQIALVILFGLLADYITTWFQNVGLLRWYLRDKDKDEENDEDEEEEDKKKPRYVRRQEKTKNSKSKKRAKAKKGKRR